MLERFYDREHISVAEPECSLHEVHCYPAPLNREFLGSLIVVNLKI